MTNKFNPKIYRSRKTIPVKLNYILGIRQLYDWSEKLQRYIKRTSGLKYSAITKIGTKQKEKFFESIEEAKRWRINGGIEEDILDSNLLFEDLLNKYFSHIENKINPSTFKTYSNNSKHLSSFFPYKVKDIRSHTIDMWLEKVKVSEYLELCKSSKLSFSKEIKLLRQIFNYYAEYIDENFICPVRKRHNRDCIINLAKYKESKNKNKTRFMSSDQMNLFLKYFKGLSLENPCKKVFYALALFQIRTGVRIGEACALQYLDLGFDFSKPKALIHKSVSWKRGKGTNTTIQNFTKTCESRDVYLSNDIEELLKDLSIESESINNLIFSKDGITPLTYRSIQYEYDKAFKKLGYNFRSTHIMRHSYSTDFLRVTGDQHALSKLLGHSSLRQTEHYAKITESKVEIGFDTYSNHLENVIPLFPKMGTDG